MASGWKKKSSTSDNVNFLNHSGEATYSNDGICNGVASCTTVSNFSYRFDLDDWISSSTVSKIGTNLNSCDEDMFTTWFASDTFIPLSEDAAKLFVKKNIDDCKQILETKDPDSYTFSYESETFDGNSYTDNGNPKICINPNSSGNTCNDCGKYEAGRPYQGHKIKYLGISGETNSGLTLPANTIGYNQPLVELYFPIREDSRKIGKIGDSAFEGISTLSAVTFGSVREIGINAFSECTSLTNIDWGCKCCSATSKVKTIGNSAFNQCTSLEIEYIPDSVSGIGSYAFSDCESLLHMNISDNVKSIGKGAFDSCTRLEDVKLPNNDRFSVISEGMFWGCTALTNVKINSKRLCDIGEKAFYNCRNLKNCTINADAGNVRINGDIGNSAFTNCTSIEAEISYNTHTIGNYAFSGCTSLVTAQIPFSVNKIGDYAFYGCTSLTSITIYVTSPNSVTLGTDVFSGSTCPIYVPSGSVNAYKNAPGWSTYASRIEAIH